ncbi:hypothetical protein JCGZ_19861 [Jatropha curcas]|uniref:EF-hand domain-containing protein n=1 Tax=Jatropha curcas TaxID=180498 RepID=A0A067JTD1_JATCU|nr:probable calcium-binding protein CML46 [Jatropha curcas]KDP27162.1 hypothetical protein JCGZ_19861 [Jatropha curcas]
MAQDKSSFLINQHKASYSDISFTLLDILLFGVFCNKFSGVQKFFSRFWFYIISQLSFSNSKVWEEKKNQDSFSCFDNKIDDRNISREEVEMVMGNLGLLCRAESEKLKDSMGFDELSQLFDDKEPSLEEIKEAFDVFDYNRDGFIDAEELQRVLCKLGLKEGFKLENCRKMIRASDENKDGRIDFREFVKFMENSFYAA